MGTTHQGELGPPGTPWWVVPPSGHPQAQPGPVVFLLAHKNSPWSFMAFGLRRILIFCDVKNMEKQQLALGTMSIGSYQKMIKNDYKMIIKHPRLII